MKRREFISHTTIASLGLSAMPALLTPKNPENLILGQGSHRYQLDTGWGKLNPEQYPVKDCHEMVEDSQGRILLLTNHTKNNVLIYDKSGKLLGSWGTEYPGAHGLTLSKENGEDFLFISDNDRHQVIKTTLDGKVVMTLDYPSESGHYQKAEEYIPTEVAIGHNGDIYVADGYGQQWITQYNHKGEYIRSFGGRGNESHNLQNAHVSGYPKARSTLPDRFGQGTKRIQALFAQWRIFGDHSPARCLCVPARNPWKAPVRCRSKIKSIYR